MTLARALIAEVPALRRFCRALFGDVSRADRCLETMLTHLLSGTPSRISHLPNVNEPHLRLILLRNLIDYLPARLNEHDPCGSCQMERSAHAVLKRLPKSPLIAFLLRTLEEFDDEDIAYVLRISSLQARLLVELGSACVAGEIATKILIIDGDPAVASLLGALIGELGHDLCGIAHTADEALRLAEVEDPGLIISELASPDQSITLTMFSQLLKSKDVPLIIITNHPELWTNPPGIYPAGIITKPFLKDVVRSTISKALFFDRRSKAPYWDYEKVARINH